MEIAVLGTIVADTIEHADGSVTESLGGIAHSVAVLAALSGGGHRIVPVCRVGADCAAAVEAYIASLPGVTLDGVTFDPQPNPRVRLSYREADRPGERIERLSARLAPLEADEVEAACAADLALINAITGDDCTLEALRKICSACPRVYLDVHSLVLGSRADGERYYRKPADLMEWLVGADVVQCNLAEGAVACGLDPRADLDEVRAGLEGLLASIGARNRLGALLLTAGEAGAVVIERRDDIVRVRNIGAAVVEAVDPTGAGDAFGAGFAYAWLGGADVHEAARVAVHVGTAACRVAGLPAPEHLRHALDDRRDVRTGRR